MIACPENQFLFVKNKKVAGTSVEIWVSQLCGEEAIITEVGPEDEKIRRRLGYRGPQNQHIPLKRYAWTDWIRYILRGDVLPPLSNHDSVQWLRRYYPDYCNHFFSFCFERNPWDKAISVYYTYLWRMQLDPADLSLSAFLTMEGERISCWDRYTDENGNIAVDYVARFEDLEDELEEICDQIGVAASKMGKLPRAKTNIRKTDQPYWKLINAEQRDRIAELCSRESTILGTRSENNSV